MKEVNEAYDQIMNDRKRGESQAAAILEEAVAAVEAQLVPASRMCVT